jgi:hypothetical protein
MRNCPSHPRADVMSVKKKTLWLMGACSEVSKAKKKSS